MSREKIENVLWYMALSVALLSFLLSIVALEKISKSYLWWIVIWLIILLVIAFSRPKRP